VWDVETGRVLRTLEGHSDEVNGVAMSGDGRLAVSASASENATSKLWDIETGRELRTQDEELFVAVSEDRRRATSISIDSSLKVWDLGTGRAVARFACDAFPHCCAFAKPNIIVAGDAGGRVYFLALEDGRAS
jgi:WD40 repeat protein